MRKIEKTFTVSVPVAKAWAAFAESEERSKWEAVTYEIDPSPGGAVHWSFPGVESTGRVEEVMPERLLRHVELSGPHVTADITVTFEEVDGGTRIRITHAGFGDAAESGDWFEGTSIGWDQAIADLILYLHTGVAAHRFASEMHGPGMTMTDTDAGVQVVSVMDGMLAQQAGVGPGDILLRVAGVPVFHITDIWVLMREHAAGTKLELEWVRDGERAHGVGVLTGGWDAPA